MIISHKHKFIFIKTHKTAGTSTEVDLSEKCGNMDIVTPIEKFEKNKVEVFKNHFPRNYKGYKNHMIIESVRNQLKNMKIFNSYFKFCVEREPVDKLLSYFYWNNRNDLTSENFKRYVDLMWENYIFSPFHKHNSDFCHWTIDGELAVDKILRYENLKKELKETCKQLGFDIELTTRAKSYLRKDKVLPRPNITNEQIEKVYKNWKISNSFTGYKIEDCKYYEN